MIRYGSGRNGRGSARADSGSARADDSGVRVDGVDVRSGTRRVPIIHVERLNIRNPTPMLRVDKDTTASTSCRLFILAPSRIYLAGKILGVHKGRICNRFGERVRAREHPTHKRRILFTRGIKSSFLTPIVSVIIVIIDFLSTMALFYRGPVTPFAL